MSPSTPEARALAAELATEPLLIADTERVHFANQAFADLVGVPIAEIENKAVDQFVTILEEPLVVDRLRSAMRQGQPFRGEASCYTAGGEVVPVDLAVFPGHLGDQTLYVVSATDLRHQKRLESRLRQSQRLEALGRFADAIAHEVNNVVHVLAGSSSLLAAAKPGTDPVQADLKAIEEAARRGERLLRDLLDFSRPRPIARIATDLNDAIESWRYLLEIFVGPEIRLIVDLAPDVPPVHADRHEIQHILINLVANAQAAMPEGGTLTVTTHAVRPDPTVRTSVAERFGEYAVLTVADTGRGMSAGERAKAFDSYATPGLGLATVQGIVRESGGLLWIRSQPAVGTSVEIQFQALHGAVVGTSGRTSLPRAPRRGSETILLVDDDPLVLRVARRGLEGLGYRVLPAQSAAEATAIAAELGTEIALLVTDVMMPGQRGTGLAAELQAELPSLKVLFVSGHPDAGGSDQSGRPALHLTKPFSADELGTAVRLVLDA
jgi:two-component system, cell cycle sensor histidine kinase and response regulator CckA